MMAASGTCTSVATAIAASALSTLCMPGRLSSIDSRLVVPLTRTQSNSMRPPSARTFSARMFAFSDRP